MRPTQSKNGFNSIYPETKNRKPTSAEKKEIERIRRYVDLVRDACSWLRAFGGMGDSAINVLTVIR